MNENENQNEIHVAATEALRALVARLRERSSDPRADLLLLATLVVTGCRASEVLQLTRADVDGEQCLIRIGRDKGPSRWLPVPDYLAQELVYQAARGTESASDRLFVTHERTGAIRPITYTRLRRMLAGYPRHGEVPQPVITVHQLRARTIALLAAHRAIGVATALGHADRRKALTHVARDLGLALAVVEVFGGDHPWLHDLPGGPAGHVLRSRAVASSSTAVLAFPGNERPSALRRAVLAKPRDLPPLAAPACGCQRWTRTPPQRGTGARHAICSQGAGRFPAMSRRSRAIP